MILLSWQRSEPSKRRWTSCVRGDVVYLSATRATKGHEQAGARFAVILQSDELVLSTLIIAPTSRSAPPREFRPTIAISGEATQVLVDQATAVAPERLGKLVGHLSRTELEDINDALRLVLELD